MADIRVPPLQKVDVINSADYDDFVFGACVLTDSSCFSLWPVIYLILFLVVGYDQAYNQIWDFFEIT